jgi:hypothetical protein
VATWGEFAAEHPSLAEFGAARIERCAAYLATVRADGTPRVHPVMPVIGDGRLFLFMDSTSPKRHDLRARGSYALHTGVEGSGTGGEFFITGMGRPCDEASLRAAAVAAATYDVDDAWILFELDVTTARGKSYGDVTLPEPSSWTSRSS